MNRIQKEVGRFTDDRPIVKEHNTPFRVSIMLVEEAVELLRALTENEPIEEVMGEIADVQFLLASLSNSLVLDLGDVTHRKIARNNEKYPKEHLQDGDYDEKMTVLKSRWDRSRDKEFFNDQRPILKRDEENL